MYQGRFACPFPIFYEFRIPDNEDFIQQERPDGSTFLKLPGAIDQTYTFYTVGDDCQPTNPYIVDAGRGGNALFSTPVDGPFDDNEAIKQAGKILFIGTSSDVFEQGVPFEPNNTYSVMGKIEYTIGRNITGGVQVGFQRTYTKVTGQVINVCDQLQQ